MTAPQLTQYAQGQGVATGDGLNTFVQCCNTVAELRDFIGTNGMQVYVRGVETAGGAGAGMFRWIEGGTALDDGYNVIVPNGATGIWQRIIEPTVFPTRTIVAFLDVKLFLGPLFVFVNKPGVGEIIHLGLPTETWLYPGAVQIIKDAKGNAGSFNITITGDGNTIDGAASTVINTNRGVVRLVWSGIEWNVW